MLAFRAVSRSRASRACRASSAAVPRARPWLRASAYAACSRTRSPGQQVVVDRLAEQGVPEDVALSVGEQDVHLDGLAQALVEAVRRRGRTPRSACRGRPGGRRRWPRGPPAGPGRRAGRAGPAARRRARRAPIGRGRRRRRRAPRRRTRCPRRGRRCRATSASSSGSGCSSWIRLRTSGAASGRELEALDAADPGPLRDLRAERVAAVQVVGAVRRHHGDRADEGPGEQEAEHVAGGLVGPVGVLDDEQGRGLLGDRLEQGVHGLEQVGPVERRRCRPPRPSRASGGRAGAGSGRGGCRRRC